MWRGGGRLNISVAAPFVWRCLTGSAVAPFPQNLLWRSVSRRKRASMAEFQNVITDIVGLREIIGSSSYRVLNKVTDRIDQLAARSNASLVDLDSFTAPWRISDRGGDGSAGAGEVYS